MCFHEFESGMKIRIDKSTPAINSYTYTCVGHKGCKFRAQFGPRRGDKKLVLKSCKPFHNGIDRFGKYDNGKKFKQQITTTISPNIELVAIVKNAKPVPKDVVKATKEFTGTLPSYNQAHQVLSKNEERTKFQQHKNYKLLIPYLEEFKTVNSGTVIDYEKMKTDQYRKFLYVLEL